MPPFAALILCSILVILIIWLQDKHNPGVSNISWLPTVWLIYSMSKPLGQWFNIQSSIEAGSELDRIFLSILMIITIILLFRKKIDLKEAIKENIAFMILLVFMLISVLWSHSFLISYRRWIKDFSSLLMALLVFSDQNPRNSIIIIIKRTVFIAIPFSLMLIKYFPIYGRQYHRWTGEMMWIGISTQKNRLALIAALSIILFLWDLWQKKGTHESKLLLIVEIGYIFLGIFLLLGPKGNLKTAAASSISFLFGILALLFFIYIGKKSHILIPTIINSVTLALITFGSCLPFLKRFPLVKLLLTMERDATLTGRTEIWSMLIPYLNKRFFFGYGKGGFWTTYLREQIAAHAHNGYLDFMLELGVVGLIIATIFLLTTSQKFLKFMVYDYHLSALFFCILFMFLIHNMAETSIPDLCVFPTSLIILFSFMPLEKCGFHDTYHLYEYNLIQIQ